MEALEAALAVKTYMVDQFSALCDDIGAARTWYEANINVWDQEKARSYVPKMPKAKAGIVLEGVPDGEREPFDCWGVEISSDPAVLAEMPGWYLECWSCSVVLVYPDA